MKSVWRLNFKGMNMTWYIARWGKIRQVSVVKETTYRVQIVMSNGKHIWMNKQSSESLVTQDFMKAKKFLIDNCKSNIERLQSVLSTAQSDLKHFASLTIEDTKTHLPY